MFFFCEYYVLILIFCLISFCIGFMGLFRSHTNLIRFLVSLEIISIAVSLIFFLGVLLTSDVLGILFIIFNLIVAGCESALGLILLINLYQAEKAVKLSSFLLLKG